MVVLPSSVGNNRRVFPAIALLSVALITSIFHFTTYVVIPTSRIRKQPMQVQQQQQDAPYNNNNTSSSSALAYNNNNNNNSGLQFNGTNMDTYTNASSSSSSLLLQQQSETSTTISLPFRHILWSDIGLSSSDDNDNDNSIVRSIILGHCNNNKSHNKTKKRQKQQRTRHNHNYNRNERCNNNDDAGSIQHGGSILVNRTIGILHKEQLIVDKQERKQQKRKSKTRTSKIIQNADAFLYTLRHPVERMLSSYRYEHPKSCIATQKQKKKKHPNNNDVMTNLACTTAQDIVDNPNGTAATFYQTCFPTANLLPLAFSRSGRYFLNHPSPSSSSLPCPDLARQVIGGKININDNNDDNDNSRIGFINMVYDIKYYAHRTILTYPSKAVLVVRTESLWDDLRDLDVKFGGTGSLDMSSEGGTTSNVGKIGNDNTDHVQNVNRTIPIGGYRLLCCAMQQEMHTYRRLLDRAVNLDEASKVATITSAAQQCGFPTWNTMVDRCQQEFFGMHQIVHGNLPTTSLLPSSPSLSFNNIMFAHVGKAGGNSLRVLFQTYCESERHKIDPGCYESPDSVLSDQTKGFFHSNFMRPKFGAVAAADAYLYNLRHPVDRMLSWYSYEHPQSCLNNTATRIACHTAAMIEANPQSETALFFRTCFPSQLSLPLAFRGTASSVLQRTCADLIRKVFAGKMIDHPSGEAFKPIQGFKHISYNMRYYKNRTLDQFPQNNVLVLRTELLWDDLKDLDTKLGGYGTFGQREGFKDSHGSEQYRKKKDALSAAEYSVLCCALLDQMNIYRDLLDRAANLDESTKNSTLANVAQKCSFASWNDMIEQCSTRNVIVGANQIDEIDSTTSLVPTVPNLQVDNITFVHAGKTGRDALRVLLKHLCESHRDYFFSNNCPEAPDSVLANQISGYVYLETVRPSNEAVAGSDALFYTVGRPVDDLISWYSYEHPDSCSVGHEFRLACDTAKEVATNGEGTAALFFRKCFPTFDLLLQAFRRTDSGSRNCQELARNVLAGRIDGPGFIHISHSIGSYVNRTLDQLQGKVILVARTGDSLWNDLKDLDFQLGGTGYFGYFEQRAPYRVENNTTYSKTEYGLLCCAMMHEMLSYRDLIVLAENLDETAKEDAIGDAVERCGFASWDEMVSQCTARYD